jgi:5'-3' exoribonuclease 1
MGVKKAVVKGIPFQAVLKPNHAVYKLHGQHFALGDRVVMVQDTGSVPLCAKGVVVGLHSKVMEILWDNSFISGTNLSGRYIPAKVPNHIPNVSQMFYL